MIKSVCKIMTNIADPRKKRNEQLNISRDIRLFIEKVETEKYDKTENL